MFYKRFDEINTSLNKLIKGNKTFTDAAAQFEELARTQDEENPFEYGLVALAKFGEMQCWQKVKDKQKTVRTAVKAARLFIKAATYNYTISKNLRDTWSDPLADGLQCYKIASEVLKSDGKPNLTVVLLIERGRIEKQFELFHYAGNTYEESVKLCLEKNLTLPLLFDSVFNCVDCYSRADRIDLALSVVEKVQQKIQDTPNSPHVKRLFLDLKIFKGILLLSSFKFEELVEFSKASFDENVANLFIKMGEATKGNQIVILDNLVNQTRNSAFFTEMEVDLFNRHKTLLEKSVEAAYAELAQ
uniref:Uncharacterized protein n=1 Tax=Coptotermes formosanus TaxID=36987 RepID=R4UWH9_COPFO|nr:hypothetical protein [Coptotermes formosanus]